MNCRIGRVKDVEIGLCGWNGSQASYFEMFRSIEIQTTFYDPPALRVAEKWKSDAPADFRFCIKAWQLITHVPSSPTYRRLRTPVADADKPFLGSFQPTEQVMRAWERTVEIARCLDARVILFQCPKSFVPSDKNLSNFCSFFRTIRRRGLRQLAWEPRGEDWTEDIVSELCQEFDLCHCVDPFAGRSAHGSLRYWRLHGRGSYSYRYSDADLVRLKSMLLREIRPGFLMFNNFSSKADAIRFSHLLESSE
ncbi:MAG TPA: DUF72 domain-containing protein [Bryobacteraceae bacterium]|nr:DUF72 domain-containing protein [Bryobacteraceae bacterium]